MDPVPVLSQANVLPVINTHCSNNPQNVCLYIVSELPDFDFDLFDLALSERLCLHKQVRSTDDPFLRRFFHKAFFPL